jgi:molybdenum cofactor cytidylyltransferase
MACLLKGGGGLSNRTVIGAVLLAAGEARRLNGIPKPLLELGGVPLIRRNLIALSGAGVDELVVVLGHQAEIIEPSIRDFPVTLVHNPVYATGQATSMRLGLAALGGKLDAIIIALADQPLINADDIVGLISAFKKRDRGRAVIPRVDGQRANPIIFEADLREEILAGGADLGCRKWTERHPDQVHFFDSPNRHYAIDIDTPEDIERFGLKFGHRLRLPAERETTLA